MRYKTGEIKKKIFSEEHRNNLKKAKVGIKRPPFKRASPTLEARKNMSIAQKKCKPEDWKGFSTSKRKRTVESLEYIYWRKECFKRDNFTCQKTGKRGGKLVVHHINNFAEFPELRMVISNGITLSEGSHREFHKKYGFRNNTKEQLDEFLKV